MSGHDFISRSDALEHMEQLMRKCELDPDNEAHRCIPMWDANQISALLILTPDADVVPMDYHERCLQLEIQKRIAAEKTARQCIENYEPVKRGHWIPERQSVIPMARSNGKGISVATCSECKTLGSPMWKRCPVCEVKMYAPKEE